MLSTTARLIRGRISTPFQRRCFCETKKPTEFLYIPIPSVIHKFKAWDLKEKIAACGLVVTIWGALYVADDHWKESPAYARRQALKQTMKPFNSKKLEYAKDLWVTRDAIPEALAAEVSAPSNLRQYAMIVGNRGSGKSALCYNFVEGKEGVIYLKIGTNGTSWDEAELATLLLDSAGYTIKDPHMPVSILTNLLRAINDELPSDRVPIVLIEIERTATDLIVERVCRPLKDLRGLALFVVTATDVHVTANLKPDPGRRLTLWLGDFEEDQAREFVSKLNIEREKQKLPKLIEEDIDFFITKVGTRPVDLQRLVTKKNTKEVHDLIEERISKKKGHIDRLLRIDPNYKLVLRALLNSNSSQLPESMVMDFLKMPIAKIMQTCMTDHAVLSFNPIDFTVEFNTRAAAVAAERWAETEDHKEEQLAKLEEERLAKLEEERLTKLKEERLAVLKEMPWCMSYVLVHNDTEDEITVHGHHRWGILGGAFGKTDSRIIKSGDVAIVQANCFSWGIGRGVSLSSNNGKTWVDGEHGASYEASEIFE